MTNNKKHLDRTNKSLIDEALSSTYEALILLETLKYKLKIEDNKIEEETNEDKYEDLFHSVFEKLETRDHTKCLTNREMAHALETHFESNEEFIDLFDVETKRINGEIKCNIQRRTNNMKWKAWMEFLKNFGVNDFNKKRFHLKERGRRVSVYALKVKERV